MGPWCSRFNPIPVERMPKQFRLGRQPATFDRAFESAFHNAEERAIMERRDSMRRVEEEDSEDDTDDPVDAVLSGRSRNLQKLLLSKDNLVSVKTVDAGGHTLLHYAAESGSSLCAQTLVMAGADINAQNVSGLTPLHMAIMSRHLNLVKRFITEFNADVNIAEDDGWTPLHLCAHNGDVELIELLIKHGADCSLTTKNGNSPYDISYAVSTFINKKAKGKNMVMREYEEKYGEKHRATCDLLWEVKHENMAAAAETSQQSEGMAKRIESLKNLFARNKQGEQSPQKSSWRNRRAMTVSIPDADGSMSGNEHHQRSNPATDVMPSAVGGEEEGQNNNEPGGVGLCSLAEEENAEGDDSTYANQGSTLDTVYPSDLSVEDHRRLNSSKGSVLDGSELHEIDENNLFSEIESAVATPTVPRKEHSVRNMELESREIELMRGAHWFEPLATPSGSSPDLLKGRRGIPNLEVESFFGKSGKKSTPVMSPEDRRAKSMAIFEDTSGTRTPKGRSTSRGKSHTPEIFSSVVDVLSEHNDGESKTRKGGAVHFSSPIVGSPGGITDSAPHRSRLSVL